LPQLAARLLAKAVLTGPIVPQTKHWGSSPIRSVATF
jgi:hypothetical protein